MASAEEGLHVNANAATAEAKALSDTSEARDEELGVSSKSESKIEQDGTSEVDWDGPEDPHNPRNWSSRAKIINCLTIILLTLLTPLASSMFAPGVPDVRLLPEYKPLQNAGCLLTGDATQRFRY